MSGECEKCGEHCLECTCKQKRPSSITVKWIDVSSSRPSPGKRVLGTDGTWVEVVWYNGKNKGEMSWGSLSLLVLDITHWAELPEPPEIKD